MKPNWVVESEFALVLRSLIASLKFLNQRKIYSCIDGGKMKLKERKRESLWEKREEYDC